MNYVINFIKRIYQIVFIASRCNIVVYQKAVIPKSKINLIKYIKKKNIKVIFDVDDAIFLDKRDNSNEIATLADVVVVGNTTLQEYYNNYAKNIILIPTIDYTPDYEKFHKYTFKNKCVGWIGSHSTINNLDLVVHSLNRLNEKYPDTYFKFICDDSYGYDEKIKSSKFVNWNKNTYLQEMQEFTVGIMPLRNTDYNSGKCGFKLIQYLNMKKPVIASDIGVNRTIVDSNGLVADTSEEWIHALEKLLYNEKRYNDCIRSIERIFYKKYHYNKIRDKWLDILDGKEILE